MELEKVNTMNKCQGCGALIQTENSTLEGFAQSSRHLLCERCFRIKHYNDYQPINKDNNHYIEILNKIKFENALTLLVVDLFQIYDLNKLKPFLGNKVVLVLTKRDLLPSKIYEDKILNYFEQYEIDFLDKIIVSSKNNYNFDSLYQKILDYKISNKVYIVGYTNAGKSTLINKLLSLYSSNKQEITTSSLPSTTLDTIEVPFNDDFDLIDTPGLLVEGSLLDKIDSKLYNKVVPKKAIAPRIYQIKCFQCFKIDDFAYLKINGENVLVFYLAHTLKIERYFKDKNPKDLQAYTIELEDRQDIVINGLGFIKVMGATKLVLYLQKGVSYSIRPSLI